MNNAFGEYGGEALMGFSATVKGETKEYKRGDTISVEDAMEWSIVVRRALVSTGKVLWYPTKYASPASVKEVEEIISKLKKDIEAKEVEVAQLQEAVALLKTQKEVVKKTK